MSNQSQKRQTALTVKVMLENNKETIFGALPRHITPERMIRVVMSNIRANPKLLDCDQTSLLSAISQASTLGLETDGVLGHAYIVPYGKEATLIPGYKGLIDLCRRSGIISTVTMECVHEGDVFEYALGDKPRIHHVPDDQNPLRHNRPITYVYVVVVLRDGGVQRKVWSAAKINHHRDKYSPGYKTAERKKKDSPWHTNWDVMAKKTVIRDMINRGELPVSAEIQKFTMQDEILDARVVRDHVDSGIKPVDSLDDLTNRLEDKGADPAPGQTNGSAERKPNPVAGLAEALANCKTVYEIDHVETEYLDKTDDPELFDQVTEACQNARQYMGQTASGTKQG